MLYAWMHCLLCLCPADVAVTEYANVLSTLGLLRRPVSASSFPKSISSGTTASSASTGSNVRGSGSGGLSSRCRGASRALELEVIFQGITRALMEVRRGGVGCDCRYECCWRGEHSRHCIWDGLVMYVMFRVVSVCAAPLAWLRGRARMCRYVHASHCGTGSGCVSPSGR